MWSINFLYNDRWWFLFEDEIMCFSDTIVYRPHPFWTIGLYGNDIQHWARSNTHLMDHTEQHSQVLDDCRFIKLVSANFHLLKEAFWGVCQIGKRTLAEEWTIGSGSKQTHVTQRKDVSCVVLIGITVWVILFSKWIFFIILLEIELN